MDGRVVDEDLEDWVVEEEVDEGGCGDCSSPSLSLS